MLPVESAARYVEDVDRDPVVIFDGLTKNWRYPGWRVTWTVGPKQVIEALTSAGSLPRRRRQQAAAARRDPAARARTTSRRRRAPSSDAFREKRDLMLSRLERLGVRFDRVPDGTFYVWGNVAQPAAADLTDGMGFFRAALEQKVITVPGEFFDVNPGKRRSARASRFRDYVRFSFGPAMAVLERATERLEALVRRARATVAVAAASCSSASRSRPARRRRRPSRILQRYVGERHEGSGPCEAHDAHRARAGDHPRALPRRRWPVGRPWAIGASPSCASIPRAMRFSCILHAPRVAARTVDKWAESAKLEAVLNAAMYADNQRSVGLMVLGAGVNNGGDNKKYGGFLAWDRTRDGIPEVAAFGRDCAGFDLDAIRRDYRVRGAELPAPRLRRVIPSTGRIRSSSAPPSSAPTRAAGSSSPTSARPTR